MTYESRFPGAGVEYSLDIWCECTTRISKSWPLLRYFAYPFQCLLHADTFILTDRLSFSFIVTVIVRQHLPYVNKLCNSRVCKWYFAVQAVSRGCLLYASFLRVSCMWQSAVCLARSINE